MTAFPAEISSGEQNAGVGTAGGLRDLSRRDRLLAFAAPLLLVVVALFGVLRVHTIDQSAWSGATFAMFSRYEGETTRFFRVTVVHDDGSVTHPAPHEAADEAVRDADIRARVVPTEAEVRRLAAAILDAESAERVTVELWKVDVERAGPSLRSRPVLRVEVRA